MARSINNILVRGAQPLRDELRRQAQEFKGAQRRQMRRALGVLAREWRSRVRSRFRTSGVSYSVKSRKRVGRMEDVRQRIGFEGSPETSLIVVGRITPRASWTPVHEFGRTIRPRAGRRGDRRKPYLVFIAGGQFVKTEEVRIPPRPFVDSVVQAKAQAAVDIIGEAFGVFSEGRARSVGA